VLRSDTHRVVTVSSVGAAGSPIVFLWRSEPGAASYRLTVVDSTGTIVWSERLPDTTLAAPAVAGLAPSREYRWWVEAYLHDGTSTRSEVRRFRTTP
jgi:hypothetical protein